MHVLSEDLGDAYTVISDFANVYKKPVFIMKDGEIDTVILSIDAYREMMEILEVREKILEGLESVERGDVIPLEEVLREAESAIK